MLAFVRLSIFVFFFWISSGWEALWAFLRDCRSCIFFGISSGWEALWAFLHNCCSHVFFCESHQGQEPYEYFREIVCYFCWISSGSDALWIYISVTMSVVIMSYIYCTSIIPNLYFAKKIYYGISVLPCNCKMYLMCLVITVIDCHRTSSGPMPAGIGPAAI